MTKPFFRPTWKLTPPLIEALGGTVTEDEFNAHIKTPRLPGVSWPRTGTMHPNSKRFHEILREHGDLHDAKQAGYGRPDDPFHNVRSSQEWGVDGWIGAMVRLNDKVRRLQSHVRNGDSAFEMVEDNLRDIAVYATIGLVLYEEDQFDRALGVTPLSPR
jgi:hypothetical protein